MKNTLYTSLRTCCLILLFIGLATVMLEAQCPMCRMSAETNLKGGGSDAAGLNKGIIYLLTIPYILMGTIGYLWWKNRLAVLEEENEEALKSLLEEHDMVISASMELNEEERIP